MPRIPTYKSRAVSLPRAPISKGAQEWEILGHGLKEMAATLAAVDEKMRQARQVKLLSDAKTDSTIRQIEFSKSLDDRDDPENFVSDHKRLTDEIATTWRGKIKDREVLNMFKNHHKVASARLSLAIKGIARTKEIKLGKEDFFKKINEIKGRLSMLNTSSADEITKAVSLNELKSLADGYVIAGFIDERTGNAKLEEVLNESKKANIWNSALETMRNRGYEEAISYLNDSGLEISEINSMASALKREETFSLAREKEENAAALENWENEALVKLRNKELTFQQIIESPLESKRKEHWIKAIDTQAEASLKGKEAGFKEALDIKFYNERLNEAYEGKLQIDSIPSWIGKYISISDAEHLRSVNKAAQEPDKSREMELIKMAISSGRKRILKPDPLTLFAFEADSEKQAFLFEHALRKVLAEEKDEAKRVNMLIPGTKEYIIEDLIRTFQLEITEGPTTKKNPINFYSE